MIALYNAPLLTGEWIPEDILVLCLIYPMIYSLTHNSAGLIASYVAVYELPIAAAVLQGWGEAAYTVLLYLRVSLMLASLVIMPVIIWRVVKER